MKICHVISSVDINYGGTTEYLRLTANELTKHVSNIIVSNKSANPVKFHKDVNVVLLEKESLINVFSTKIENTLIKVECDIFHGNGLWERPVHSMSKIAKKRNIPYVISIHGMLEPWSLEQGRLKKKIALTLFQNKDLQNATCIHATAKEEAENIRQLGFKNPIAIIPNGISLDEFPQKTTLNRNKLDRKKRILFLSRIHPKKGIENLIDAWGKIDKKLRKDWIVEIVGNGDVDYIEGLKKKILNANINNQIAIKEPAFGQKKYDYFRNADLFVLPTYSENFGIVIAEALASYTPVITTKGAPWEDLNTYKCGWWIDIGVEPLREAIEKAIISNDLEKMAQNGREVIENKYSLEVVAKNMTKLYEWLLNKNNMPKFIEL